MAFTIIVTVGHQALPSLARLRRPASVGSPVYGAGESHPEVDAHALLAHDTVEVTFVREEFEVGKEAEGAERK